MTPVYRIAREEWRLMLRDRAAFIAICLLCILAIVAAITTYERQRLVSEQREDYQAQVNQEFDAQPDRHPHRMVHYGQFIFRPLNPWAAFDMGIDSYTGNTLFLEGHRQNSANFGDVRQSSLLLRFGELTPAFVLQVLAPLMLIFVGYGVVSRERETGTLKILMSQGIDPGQILLAKLLALMGLAALALIPTLVALFWIAFTRASSFLPAVALLLGYAAWLCIWSLAVVFISTLLAKGREALLLLFGIWALAIILLPRLLPDVAASMLPLATRFETDIAIAKDLSALGDSHNPDDPYFKAFKKQTLEKYGVSKVEELPVNYKGLVGMEGERLTSKLFDEYSDRSFAQQVSQNYFVDMIGVLSPLIALRRLSMAASGTDLQSYQRFVDQGEQYRYELVQSLNQLQVNKVTYSDDRNPNKQNRIDHSHWHDMPDFIYVPEAYSATLWRMAPAFAILLLWLTGLAAIFPMAARYLARNAR